MFLANHEAVFSKLVILDEIADQGSNPIELVSVIGRFGLGKRAALSAKNGTTILASSGDDRITNGLDFSFAQCRFLRRQGNGNGKRLLTIANIFALINVK